MVVQGFPQLILDTSNANGFGIANYTSGAGTNILTFHYTVQTGDNTPSNDFLTYVDIFSLNLPVSSDLQDLAGNSANRTLPSPSMLFSYHIVLDTTTPSVTSVTSFPSVGIYGTGAHIWINVTFSEPVAIRGIPGILLWTAQDSSAVNESAIFQYSSSSHYVATFLYTVVVGDGNSHLSTIGFVFEAGASVADFAGNLAALPDPFSSISLYASSALTIDTIPPDITEHSSVC